MPHIEISIFEGRSLAEKEALAESVAHAVSESLNVPLSSVRMRILESPRENVAVAGKLSVAKDVGL